MRQLVRAAGCGQIRGGNNDEKELLSAVMHPQWYFPRMRRSKDRDNSSRDNCREKEDITTAGTTAAETAEAAGGTLIVGFDQDFPPMGFVGDNGESLGFDLDLEEVANRLGLEYKARPIAGTQGYGA
ncbi:MAG: transporter substrate-binding domain-containing protein [Clostridium fessum]